MDEKEMTIRGYVEPLLQGEGYSLYDLKLTKSSLSVVVDRDQPISLDEIVAISEKISALLDEKDPIEGAYSLDVSSSGAEKRIDPSKLDAYLGSYVNITLHSPLKGENVFEGTLGEEEGKLTLTYFDKGRKKTISFDKDGVAKSRLAIKF